MNQAEQLRGQRRVQALVMEELPDGEHPRWYPSGNYRRGSIASGWWKLVFPALMSPVVVVFFSFGTQFWWSPTQRGSWFAATVLAAREKAPKSRTLQANPQPGWVYCNL